MKCSDCGKRMKPIAIIDERYYHGCDWCLEEFCDNCCEVDEDTGLCKCHDCIEQALIDARNGREPQEPII